MKRTVLPSLRRCADEAVEGAKAVGVEGRGGLVEEQHRRVGKHRDGQAEALHHAAGVRAHRAAARAVERRELEHVVDARRGHAAQGAVELQHLAAGRATRGTRRAAAGRRGLAGARRRAAGPARRRSTSPTSAGQAGRRLERRSSFRSRSAPAGPPPRPGRSSRSRRLDGAMGAVALREGAEEIIGGLASPGRGREPRARAKARHQARPAAWGRRDARAAGDVGEGGGRTRGVSSTTGIGLQAPGTRARPPRRLRPRSPGRRGRRPSGSRGSGRRRW